ncbi:hypothetical protein K0504_09255 [Neiella marina]|uniref:Glycerophosphoryl diester phosphodiesterase membrane domain-containing protein n=1 Tax=Neiella holothuriorum TaxID=2870530 RepID=A0ABS7EFU1_9GAMM|nr:hypothetical protein [Neiella holothuriorum]MBW8191222.1 hypothetical protein [Neiella holothuriorum]
MDDITNKLPIKSLLFEAASLCISNYKSLFRFVAPFIITLVLAAVFSALLAPSTVDEGFPVTFFIGFVVIFIMVGATAVMAVVGCHRTFLLTPEEVRATKAFRWSGRELRFVGWWLVIGICAALLSIPLAMVGTPLLLASAKNPEALSPLMIVPFTLIYLPLYYVISRWTLVLPATATDERNKSLSWAWQLSKGNGLRLLLLLTILPFSISLAFAMLQLTEWFVFSLLQILVSPVVAVFEICLLSLSYSYLTRFNDDDSVEVAA